jgi:hypothetical protein
MLDRWWRKQFVSEDIKARFKGDAAYADQAERCQRALDVLADTLAGGGWAFARGQ